MSTEVRLPQLADNLTAAKVGAWLKREGDAVKAGEPIVEVETDKTNVEIEAPVSGFLTKILIAAGTDAVPIDSVLAIVSEGRSEAGAPAPVAATKPVAAAPALHVVAPSPPATIAEPRVPHVPTETPIQATARPSGDVNATPVAKKIARLTGVDLSAVTPATGTKITRSDVERVLGRPLSAASAPTVSIPTIGTTASTSAAELTAGYDEEPLTAMRRVTAARLQTAKQTVPHFYLQFDCRVDALIQMRTQWNSGHPDAKLTITDFLVFALSRALRQVPQANAAWAETAVRVYKSVDLAVAVNTPKGLITPIVRGSADKSLVTICREIAALAERARAGKLRPDEYTGATFTLSNLGMFAVSSITPIVNPPAACILGVGAIESRPVVSAGQVVAGHTMNCTLAADHRAIDGATGAEFMAALRRRLEDPFALTLEG